MVFSLTLDQTATPPALTFVLNRPLDHTAPSGTDHSLDLAFHVQAVDAAGHATRADLVVDVDAAGAVTTTHAAGDTIDYSALQTGVVVNLWNSTFTYPGEESLAAHSATDLKAVADTNSIVGFDALGPAIVNAFGSQADDVLKGGDEANELHGNGGDDIIRASGGDDKLYGDAGSDFLYGDDGNDLVVGSVGNDVLFGDVGDDTLWGDNQDGTGSGNDAIDAGEGNNIVQAGAGDDTITAGGGADQIWGDDGNDLIYAYGGNDTIDGGAGDDTIHDGAGNDRIIGGAGSDLLQGQAGADTFVYSSPTDGGTKPAGDTIKGFDANADKIELDLSGFGLASTSDFDTLVGFGTTVAAGTADQRFFAATDGVNKAVLYYDADGFNTGSLGAIALATIEFSDTSGTFDKGDIIRGA